MRATFEEKLEAEMVRRIARLTPPPVRFTSGPPNAFRVGEYVEESTFGPSRAKGYRQGFLGRVPEERCVLVHLAEPASRFVPLGLSPISSATRRVIFRARRMHTIFETETTVHRVEWWTWVPEDSEARVVEAARTAVHLVPEILRITRDLDLITHKLEDRASIMALTIPLREIVHDLAAAAHEWLATPDASARPEDRRAREFSRW